MKKKLVCVALAVMLALSLATVALATVGPNSPPPGPRGGWSCPHGLGRGFMRGDDGGILTAEAFAQRVDEAIRDGFIAESDRERLIKVHRWCFENGRPGNGARGPGRGRGMAGGGGFGCRWR